MKQTNNIPQIDKSKLTPEQRDKLDSYNQAAAQIKSLKDIADLADNIYAFLEDSKKEGEKTDKEEGALLMDMRDALRELNAKEMPETPEVDNKPIIDAVSKLEAALSKAIKGIDIKPVVKVDAPQVHLNPTEVDLKGIEEILKTDIPEAFKKAVASIPVPPKPDNKELLKAWDGISEQLLSIETATRMKPLPGSITVNNTTAIPVTDGFLAAVNYDYIDVQQTSATIDTYVYKLGGSGGVTVRTVVVTYTSSAKTDIDTVSYA